MLSGNQESPAAPADHYDTLATLPTTTTRLDALDLLLRKITQLRDLCNTCSNPGDDAIHGVFWFMADTLQCCEQLADSVFKGEAGQSTPERTETQPTEASVQNNPLADSVVIPLANYEQLGLAIETLRAQALIISDPETRQTNTERTMDGVTYGMVCEVDRISDLLSGCKTLRATFNHRHGPELEQPQ